MPFSTTGSVISTDLDNMLRGIYRDNSDSTVNNVGEVTIKSTTIAANSIGATGGLRFVISGSIGGTAGTKTIRLKFGSTTLATITQAAGTTSDWFFDVFMFNAASNSQRWHIQRNGNDLLTSTFDYTTSAEDTTANKALAVTGQLGNAADAITASIMSVFIVQIN